MSTAKNYQTPRSTLGILLNIGKHNAYSVPAEGRQKHELCVYDALDNLNIGEQCEWATRNAYGHVQILAHYPTGSGYCTVLLNSFEYKGDAVAWRDTACISGNSNNWKFIGS